MKERITISIESRAISLVDTLVGKDNIQNRSQAIEAIINEKFSSAREVKAVILAAGKANTENIGEILGHLQAMGVREVIVAGAKNNEGIFPVINGNSYFSKNAIFLKEEKNLGTAGIIKSAENYINGPFIVIFSDVRFSIDLKELFSSHKASGKTATMAITITDSKKDMLDRIKVTGNTATFFEYKSESPTKIQNAGILVFEQQALDRFPSKGSLEHDVLPKLAKESRLGVFLFDSNWKHKG